MDPYPVVNASPITAVPAPSPALARSIPRRSLGHSVAWTAAGKWTAQALTSGITVVVARILTPSDYGLVGMAALFLGFVRFLSDFGIGGAVVARSDYDRDRLASLNTCAVLLGLAGCVVTIAAAIPLGHFFQQAKLPILIVVMSGSFAVASFRVIPTAVLQRDLRFKLLAGIELLQALSAASITLLLAIVGAGYWALVSGNLVGLLLATVLTIVASPQQFDRPVLSRIRPAVSMSRDLTISSVCWYVYSNADFVVVGKFLGQSALGLYNIGWTIALLIVERVTTIIGGVTPAYLSAAKDDVVELRRYLMKVSETIAMLTFPVSIGLAFVAEDFCTVVLGPRWAAAAVPLRLLALYAGVRSLTPIVPQILIVLGEHRFVARNAMVAAVVMPTGFWIGARWGLAGVAWAWVLAFPVITVPVFARAFRLLSLSPSAYAKAVKVPLLSSLAMAGALAVFRFAAAELYPAARFGLAVVIGAMVYGGSLYGVFGLRLTALVAMIRPSRATA